MSLRGLLPILTRRPELVRLRERLVRPLAAEGDASPLSFAINGVADAAKPYLVAALAASAGRPVLFVTATEERARLMTRTMATLLGDRPDTETAQALLFPDRDAMPLERLLSSADTIRERMTALLALMQMRTRRAALPEGEDGNLPTLVISTAIRALTQPIIPPEEFARATTALQENSEINLAEFLGHLSALGYENVAEVEEPGQVSHRGGIIDIFPPTRPRPVRVELFGDAIESMRTFDPETQRSLNPVALLLIPPAHEALPSRGPEADAQIHQITTGALHPDAAERWARDRESLRQRASFDDIALYLPYLHRTASVLDFLPSDALIILDGPDQIGRAHV